MTTDIIKEENIKAMLMFLQAFKRFNIATSEVADLILLLQRRLYNSGRIPPLFMDAKSIVILTSVFKNSKVIK